MCIHPSVPHTCHQGQRRRGRHGPAPPAMAQSFPFRGEGAGLGLPAQHRSRSLAHSRPPAQLLLPQTSPSPPSRLLPLSCFSVSTSHTARRSTFCARPWSPPPPTPPLTVNEPPPRPPPLHVTVSPRKKKISTESTLLCCPHFCPSPPTRSLFVGFLSTPPPYRLVSRRTALPTVVPIFLVASKRLRLRAPGAASVSSHRTCANERSTRGPSPTQCLRQPSHTAPSPVG